MNKPLQNISAARQSERVSSEAEPVVEKSTAETAEKSADADETAISEETPSPDGDWDALETQLAAWGNQLDELQSEAHVAGSETLRDLEKRYDEINKQARALRKEAESRKEEVQDQAEGGASNLAEETRTRFADLQENVSQTAGQAKENLSDFSQKAKERSEVAAETVKETSGKLKIGALEMGKGFRRAWVELSNAFGSARKKMREANSGDPDTGQ